MSAIEPEIEEAVLANGIRLVTERMPEARSVTIGFWVGVGGRDEPPPLSGASHFLEHLVFKGTDRRSAREIAEAIDALGGEMNAFTSREHTAYYTRLPAAALDVGLDLLTDVLAQPALRPHEVDAEREVILEEILLSEDTPDDKVHSLLAEALYPGHPLGREVLGDQASVEAMTRDDIDLFRRTHYRPANIVVAAAGLLDHAAVAEGIEHYLPDLEKGVPPHREPPTADPVPLVVGHRSSEQGHIALGWRALDQSDPDRYALSVANQTFGGGMSSRLFQEVREERGLAYSVYSATSLYSDSGLLMVYAGTAPARVGEVLSVIDDQVAALFADGVTEQELQVAKGYLEGSLLLGLEDSGSRMGRLGRSELSRGEVVPVDEHLSRIRAVTLDDVGRVLKRVLAGPRSLAVVGPFTEADFN
ncbi:MAG: hypothetical protein QOK06_1516 [Acidimicrobiaceae bacterium]